MSAGVFAQLGDLPGAIIVAVLVVGLGIPAIGIAWLSNMAWRQRFRLPELFCFVAYWAIWLGILAQLNFFGLTSE